MNRYGNKLENLKMAFFDVDNTLLCLKMYNDNGNRIIGVAHPDDWLRYNIVNNAYVNCVAPKAMKRLVNLLHKKGVKIYGLTECSNSFEYNSKYNRLKEEYPGVFEHHGDLISTDSRHKKVFIMKAIAERDGVEMNEILFSDDSYMEVMEAFEAGIFSIHTTDVMDEF